MNLFKYSDDNKSNNTINSVYKKNFELSSCPDEDENDVNTVDLKFFDELVKESLYIEVKEVKIGYDTNEDIGEENGQFLVRDLISSASDKLDESKNKILNKCIIDIPKLQIDNKEYSHFVNEVFEFIDKNIEDVDSEGLNFVFKRKNRKEEINIRIALKNDDENRLGDGLLFAIDTKHKTIEKEFYDVTDIDEIISKVDYNLRKTEEVGDKFPDSKGKRILLNILRFPSGDDIFFNTAILQKTYLNKLITSIENIGTDIFQSIDECYLLYHFEDFFNWEDNYLKNEGKVFLCIKSFGTLIEDSQLFRA